MDKKIEKTQHKLIEEASEMVGSQAALARKIGILPQNMNRYATLKRELPLSLYLKIKDLLIIGGKK